MNNFSRVSMKWVKALGLLLSAIALLAVVGFNPSSSSAQTTGNTQLLWYGQSAFKLTTPAGRVLLIDPWLENPANPNGKTDLANLTQADLILITHGHMDHVGNAVEIAKKTQAKLVSTLDLGQALVQHSGYPKELAGFETQGNFGGEITLLNEEVKVAFIPAVHSSTVQSDGSPANYAGNPGGFVISVKNGPVIYHTGDTDLFSDMALIPRFGKVTLMLTCIGDKFTMGPTGAAEAVKLVKPATVIPMHYGNFNLPGTPAAFAQALQQQGVKSQLRVMKVGETLRL
ncbi:metal-dependent hydrolase [Kovacikia minuta CCNUW1]|uniref:metal-dependent hydrolase n=1 Tax=Kovacikia minuta TaxID=2931930 RepID=UPI001CC9610D|nr:metal-dependent hydrolase [Kovacikia minuta]UBF23926.1 metal-dependent hydrolase [Kovacikia minuta CCNUW1]